MDAGQFSLTVGVAEVDRAEVLRGESGEALLANRCPDLFNRVVVWNPSEDLFLFGVAGVESEALSVEQAEDILLEVDENVVSSWAAWILFVMSLTCSA